MLRHTDHFARHFVRHFARGSILVSLIFAAFDVPGATAAETIRLNSGYVSLVKLNQTVGTIVVGDPDVVDATLQGENSILLTAKKISGSAATNLLVLNAQDAEIFDATIIVGSQGAYKTEVHSKGKGGNLHEYWAYRCMPTCERVEDKLETFQRSAEASPSTSVSVTKAPGAAPSGANGGAGVPQY